MLSGYKSLHAPQVLGHEFVGVIESYGAAVDRLHQLPRGTRVVAEINCVAHESPSRLASERAHDPDRTALGIFGRPGAFAELVAVPAINVHKVPDKVPDEMAVFAEPLAAACQILHQMTPARDEPVAVIGAGRLGWLVAGMLAVCGYQPVMMARQQTNELRKVKREKLSKKFGVRLELVGEGLGDGEAKFPLVVDCTGAPGGLALALQMVKPRGTIVLKSTTAPGSEETVDLTPLVVNEVTLLGSRCGPFPVALNLMESGSFDPRPLIEEVYRMRDADKAFRRAGERGVLKVLFRMS